MEAKLEVGQEAALYEGREKAGGTRLRLQLESGSAPLSVNAENRLDGQTTSKEHGPTLPEPSLPARSAFCESSRKRRPPERVLLRSSSRSPSRLARADPAQTKLAADRSKR